MQIYLPIAELPVNMFMVFGMGGAVGFLSGLFGIGGGFLLTPLLIFSGIPPAVAVATVTSQVVASSTSGVLAYWRPWPCLEQPNASKTPPLARKCVKNAYP